MWYFFYRISTNNNLLWILILGFEYIKLLYIIILNINLNYQIKKYVCFIYFSYYYHTLLSFLLSSISIDDNVSIFKDSISNETSVSSLLSFILIFLLI